MDITTVRVERDVKQELDRLHGRFLDATGQRVSQSELLRRLLRLAKAHEAELLGDDEKTLRFPSPEQMRDFYASLEDLGYETDSSRIDDVLYGPDADP